jgi:hypothetical protein
MRISALLVIGLWGLVSVCGASDSAQRDSSVATAANPSSTDWVGSPAIARHDLIKLSSTDRPDREFRSLDSARDGDVFCLKMHVFEVKRESPHSDVVEPDGQSTCQRASKYSVKMAEEPAKAPSR